MIVTEAPVSIGVMVLPLAVGPTRSATIGLSLIALKLALVQKKGFCLILSIP